MRFRVTASYEYDVNPAHYPEGFTPEQMAQLDMDNLQDEPVFLIDHEHDLRIKIEQVS